MEAAGLKYNPEIHNRRSIRLQKYDYAWAGAYFVTVCTRNRECLFGDMVDGKMRLNDAGRMVQMVWDELPNRFSGLELDAFMVMPNHIHGVIILVGAGLALPGHEGAASGAPTLGDAARAFKSLSAIRVNRLLMRTGPLWQRNYYEHIIRDEKSLNKIREYIINNPAQWKFDRENPAGADMKSSEMGMKSAGLALPGHEGAASGAPTEDEPWRI